MTLTTTLLFWMLCNSTDNPTGVRRAQVEEGLDGSWSLFALEAQGKTVEREEVKKEEIRCVIKGNQLTFIQGRHQDMYLFEVHSRENPSKLNLINPEDEKKINHAIYALEDGKLKICVSRKMNPNTSDERPIKFTTKRKDNKNLHGLVLYVFVRERK